MSGGWVDPKSPAGRAVLERYSGVVSGGDVDVLGDLCLALDEHFGLWVRVMRGEGTAADRQGLRVLERRVEVLRGQVERAAAWSSFGGGG